MVNLIIGIFIGFLLSIIIFILTENKVINLKENVLDRLVGVLQIVLFPLVILIHLKECKSEKEISLFFVKNKYSINRYLGIIILNFIDAWYSILYASNNNKKSHLYYKGVEYISYDFITMYYVKQYGHGWYNTENKED